MTAGAHAHLPSRGRFAAPRASMVSDRAHREGSPDKGSVTATAANDWPPPVGDAQAVRLALSMAASHIRSCITGRVGNVRATSEKPAATNIAMVPV